MTDFDFMRRAIRLAENGRGFTNPNPLVGAVIAKNGEIIAEGWHHALGSLHAERDALKNAAERNADVSGSTMFVTLEPCCHHGRQPPCTDALIESGIKKVVVGSRDPNALVNGKGVRHLMDAGIEVVQDFLKDECDALNPIFFHYIRTKLPYVIVKYAMTMDGETATSAGESKWITGDAARENVHKTRSRVMAVMTGIGTVLKDDPTLNVRLEGTHRQPTRVVLDSSLRTPLGSNLVKTARDIPLVLFARESFETAEKKRLLEENGASVIFVPRGEDSAAFALKTLGERGIDSVLVESGGTVSASLFFNEKNAHLVNEVHVYIAPKIFGNDGRAAATPVRGKGIAFPSDAPTFSAPSVEQFGSDVLLTYRRNERGF